MEASGAPACVVEASTLAGTPPQPAAAEVASGSRREDVRGAVTWRQLKGEHLQREEALGKVSVTSEPLVPVPTAHGAPSEGTGVALLTAPSSAKPTSSSTALTEEAVRKLDKGKAKEVYESDDETLSSARTSLCADQPPVSASPDFIVFETVLYLEPREFQSFGSFETSCQARLNNHQRRFPHDSRPHFYLVATREESDGDVGGTAGCSQAMDEGCPFNIYVDRVDGAYSVNLNKSVWQHRHVKEENNEEEETDEEQEDDDSLAWTAATASSAMRQLVNHREDIFKRQRWRDNPVDDRCRSASLAAFKAYFSKLAPTNTVPLSSYKRYKKFCSAVKVPSLPMSYAMIALCLFASCSKRDGAQRTFKSDLLRLLKLSAPHWQLQPAFKDLALWPGANTAVDEFMLERRHLRVRHDRNPSRSIATAGGAEEPAPSDDSSYEAEESGSGQPKASPSWPVVSLPPSNKIFSTLTDVFTTLVKATVPVLGVSVVVYNPKSTSPTYRCNRSHPHYADTPEGECRFVFALKKVATGGWLLDKPRSRLKHNHGPTPQLVADPKWRPLVRNPDARKALGMPPLPGSTSAADMKEGNEGNASTSRRKGKERAIEVDEEEEERPRKKLKPVIIESSDDDSDSLIIVSRPPRIASPAPLPSTSANSSSPVAHPPPPEGLQPLQSPPSLPQHDPAAASPPPPVQPLLEAFPPSPYIASSDFVDADLAAFLASIHASLSALAPRIVADGLDSIDSLVSLTLFEPEVLHLYLDTLSTAPTNQVEGTAEVRMSVLQRRLLEKGLRGART